MSAKIDPGEHRHARPTGKSTPRDDPGPEPTF
jgi:hypothetical protein